jgi:hypothetical protein
MNSKDIESVIAAQEILELGGIVAGGGTDYTIDNSSPCGDESRSRCDSDQSSNDSTAETNGGPFPLQAVIDNAPCHTTNAGSQVGNNCSHDGAEISPKSRSGVEAEPSNPEENCSDDDVCDVVGAVVEFLGAMARSLSKHVRISQSGAAGCNVHGSSTSKIKSTFLVDPTTWVPSPAGNGIVDASGPDEHVDQTREHATTFGNSADCKNNPMTPLDP